MNAPLDVVLPTPLTPTHLTSENKSSDSSTQMIALHSVPSTESTSMLSLYSVFHHLQSSMNISFLKK